MPRVKRGTIHVKHRKNILKKAKGFKLGRKNKLRLARTAVTKAGVHAYSGRKLKKRTRRANWNVSLNAAVRPHGMKYNELIHKLKEKNITINRKTMSDLAKQFPEVFEKLRASL